MENFGMQNCVSKLVQSFGLTSAQAEAEALALLDTLQRSVSSPRSIQFQTAFSNVLQTLKKKSQDQSEFIIKYEALKSRCTPLTTNLLMIFFSKLLDENKRTSDAFNSPFSQMSTPQSVSAVRGYEDLFKSECQSKCFGHDQFLPATQTAPKVASKNRLHSEAPAIETYDRKFLRCAFVKSTLDGANDNGDVDLETKNVTEQEEILIEDILFAMQGIEGNFIKVTLPNDPSVTTDIRFSINVSFDGSLRTLASRMLPVCNDFNAVGYFLDKHFAYEYGMVAQAFCSAVRQIVEEYLTLVCQLESQHRVGQLSLQKLWFYVQPVQRSMKLLATLCSEIDKTESYGGVLLTLLHSKINDLIGDKISQDLCTFLLHTSSKPYLFMLERWLYNGQIYDPFYEFMIGQNTDKNRHASGANFDEIDDWERRYILKRDLCPNYLYSVSDKVLNCGKYLNIMSSCGHKIDLSSSKTLDHSQDDRLYLLAIEEAHNSASQRLVELLLERYSLMEGFKSLKHYFLIDQGDWFLNFLELADEELNLCVDDVRPHRLESFLDIALRTSSLATDPFRDDIKIELTSSTLTSFLLRVIQIHGDVQDSTNKIPCEPTHQVPAIEAFTIRYDAEWPLSIVFNRKIMTQYKIIFRRLLMCKYVERRLSWYWISKRRTSFENLLLHEMMTFLKNYMYYVTAEVIEPNWHRFWIFLNDKTSKKIAIDDVLREHNNLLDNCTKDCLLTESSLVEIVDKIFKLCLQFSSDAIDDMTDLKQEFKISRAELLQRMESLSSSQQEKSWADIALRLDLQL